MFPTAVTPVACLRLVRIFQDALVNGYAPEGQSVAGTSRACLRFVRIFGTIFEWVFRRQKIGLRYFKIGQTYFKICALYFFFAPMRV